LFKVGDLVDCKDPHGVWYLAEVLQVSPDGNKVFITYPTWSEKWNPLNDGKISRIYLPDDQHHWEEIQVGDKVDFFTQRNYVCECEVMAVLNNSVIKLKDARKLSGCRNLPFGASKRVGDIRKIPTSDRIIGIRK
jgi:hypothetical protein